ncbi:hypothetical protein BH24ACT15_BH24ACT15_37260 [soil metagenome]
MSGSSSMARRGLVFVGAATALVAVAIALFVALPRLGTSTGVGTATGAPDSSSVSTTTTAPDAPPASASTATVPPDQTSQPTTSHAMTEEQAVAAARDFLSADQRDAEVWRTMQGSYADVDDRLGHRTPSLDQPEDTSASADRPNWAVEFRVDVEICGPVGSECETRPGVRTIFLDAASGDWLGSSTFAPPPGEELPR